MKKRSLIVVLAVLCLATSCFVGSTFAKYTASANGTDTVAVAKWEFKQGSTAFTDSISFDLFQASTIVDTVDGNVDAEVLTDRVAPGTKGTFTTTIQNTSEVDAQYKLTFTPTNSPANIVYTFTIVNDKGTTETDDDVTVVTNGTLPADFTRIDMNETITVTANWEWAFSSTTDENYDTNDNSAAGKSFTVKLDIALEQVD